MSHELRPTMSLLEKIGPGLGFNKLLPPPGFSFWGPATGNMSGANSAAIIPHNNNYEREITITDKAKLGTTGEKEAATDGKGWAGNGTTEMRSRKSENGEEAVAVMAPLLGNRKRLENCPGHSPNRRKLKGRRAHLALAAGISSPLHLLY
jgi:hypothetical protein